MGFSFPKREKLKSRKLIDALFREGRHVSRFPYKLFYLKTSLPEDTKIQVAFAVPKRNIKSAVQRNRVKRLLRENYRLNKHLIFNNIDGSFAFLILYMGKEVPDFNEVEAGITSIFNKFLKVNEDEKGDA